MIFSFKVKKGKLVKVQYDGYSFFDCSFSQLTSLEGCPTKVGKEFYCHHNQLTSLKGCPKEVGGFFICSGNLKLTDITDLPSMCKEVEIGNCPKIKKFPPWIDDTLKFFSPTDEVRQRIKEVPFYEVVEEDNESITVQQKSIGVQLLDNL